ncbi:MAG: Re/Si-specific NAD(P)(+) transhydrogenase subunit alpha [Candidatus Dormibacteria bacterium]|jgi:NAD(P) transhydrogenase subunit alpha
MTEASEVAAPAALRIAVPRERQEGERRVALVPGTLRSLLRAGLEVGVEAGAGELAGYPDAAYTEAGATVVADLGGLLRGAAVVLHVGPPADAEIQAMTAGTTLVGLLRATSNRPLLERLAAARIDVHSLELLPRITRAQEMDVLSSMATAAGYHGVLMAAVRLPRFMPLLMTAAGTVRPARVLVVGAGVAGLQAIATARRLGAVVEAFDVRPVVREQVESLGARFVDIGVEAAETGTGYAAQLSGEAEEREREVLSRHVADADCVITTALIAGRDAPRLISAAMVAAMRPGSVIVDLAAEGGGNCELTKPGDEVVVSGVRICGQTDLASRMAGDTSQLYAGNISRFVLHLVHDGKVRDDLEDEILGATCVVQGGALRGAAAPPPAPVTPVQQ